MTEIHAAPKPKRIKKHNLQTGETLKKGLLVPTVIVDGKYLVQLIHLCIHCNAPAAYIYMGASVCIEHFKQASSTGHIAFQKTGHTNV